MLIVITVPVECCHSNLSHRWTWPDRGDSMCVFMCVCVRPRGETSTNSRAAQSPRSISSSLMHTSLSNAAISSLQSLLVLCLISLTLYFHPCSSFTFSPPIHFLVFLFLQLPLAHAPLFCFLLRCFLLSCRPLIK